MMSPNDVWVFSVFFLQILSDFTCGIVEMLLFLKCMVGAHRCWWRRCCSLMFLPLLYKADALPGSCYSRRWRVHWETPLWSPCGAYVMGPLTFISALVWLSRLPESWKKLVNTFISSVFSFKSRVLSFITSRSTSTKKARFGGLAAANKLQITWSMSWCSIRCSRKRKLIAIACLSILAGFFRFYLSPLREDQRFPLTQLQLRERVAVVVETTIRHLEFVNHIFFKSFKFKNPFAAGSNRIVKCHINTSLYVNQRFVANVLIMYYTELTWLVSSRLSSNLLSMWSTFCLNNCHCNRLDIYLYTGKGN